MKAAFIFLLGVMMGSASFAADTAPTAPSVVDKEMQTAKAREHLAELDKICTLSCEEYRDLKKALEAVK